MRTLAGDRPDAQERISRGPDGRRPVGHDPAPSRWAYRMNRLWLSPTSRRVLTVILPVIALIAASAFWVTRPARLAIIQDWSATVWQSIEARPEFQIRQMAIDGASPQLADAIRDRLSLDFPVSWFAIDDTAIHASVTALDAIADARVAVELGGALRVSVTQREAALVWRNAAGLELVDATGHRIGFIDTRAGRADLPLITGRGANRASGEALRLIATLAPLGDRVIGLARMGERRWDVVLTEKVAIKLPEAQTRRALERVVAMHTATDLLNRDVRSVDLRNPDRPTIRLGPDAVTHLQEARDFERGLAGQ